MDDNEFLSMFDEILLAPDSVIRKVWVKRLRNMLTETHKEIVRLETKIEDMIIDRRNSWRKDG